jgi:hypothetical protein
MRRVFGPRTVVEAAFLVAVPVIALAVGLGPYAIVGASAVAYLVVLLVEAVLWRERPGGAKPKLSFRLPKREPKPTPPSEPRLPAAPVEPVVVAPAPKSEPVVELTPAPEPPEPEPVRVLQPVPDPEPEPEPEPQPLAPEPPAGASVVPIGISAVPRQWNVWDLERLTREASGGDAILDEERSFLLMYLREFAGPDGDLPLDFDGLVRDSFGELVGAR